MNSAFDDIEKLVEASTRFDEFVGQHEMASGAYSNVRTRCPRCHTTGLVIESGDGYFCEGCNRELARWEMEYETET